MKKIIRLTERDLTRIVKRVIKENEGKSGSDITNYLNDNFTPDGGWDNDKFQDGWMNGELTAYYVNCKLAFIYNTEFDDDGGEREFNTLVVGSVNLNPETKTFTQTASRRLFLKPKP